MLNLCESWHPEQHRQYIINLFTAFRFDHCDPTHCNLAFVIASTLGVNVHELNKWMGSIFVSYRDEGLTKLDVRALVVIYR